MATNRYIRQGVRSEQNLYEDIVIESLKFYGQDVYYLPRTIVNEDRVFGDDIPSQFSNAYKIEMYIENTDGFDGEGDLFAKFGVEIRDQATFVIARRRWDQTVAKIDNEIDGIRPREGDLIWLPLSKSMFQIMKVEHQDPFYQLNNLVVYKMQCELFEFNDEDFDTNVEDIDNIVTDYAYQWVLTLSPDSDASHYFTKGSTVFQTLSDGTIVRGEVTQFSDSDNKLYLANVGADDGNFHSFISGTWIHQDSASSNSFQLVSSVAEDNKMSDNEQNDDFDATNFSFLDFSESNPFGEPS